MKDTKGNRSERKTREKT